MHYFPRSRLFTIAKIRPDEKASRELMQEGFAAVQSCRPDGIFCGRSFITLFGEGLPNDLILNPYAQHVASFDKGRSRQEYPGSLMSSIASAVRLLKRERLYMNTDCHNDPPYNRQLNVFHSN